MASTRATRKPPVEVPAQITITLSAKAPILQNVPDASNPWKVLNQAICTLVNIAQCGEPYWAMQASQFLVEYAANEIARREAKKAQGEVARPSRVLVPGGERQAILDELKGIYAKALGPSTLVVEAEPEDPSK